MSLVRGSSHWLVQTTSVGISGCNSMKSGVPTSISQHNPQIISRLELNGNFDVIKARGGARILTWGGGLTLEYGNYPMYVLFSNFNR